MTEIKETLFQEIKKNVSQKELEWINSKISEGNNSIQIAFISITRFVKNYEINNVTINHNFKNASLYTLVRIYFLLSLDSNSKEKYLKILDDLFDTAENNEAIALIKGLIFFNFPEHWKIRATNAVRSNVGDVFDAITFGNYYPKMYFSESEWNQMILKCIFNEKSINKIEGLIERANESLAKSISDLAHERWAAGRTFPPYVWQLVTNFVDNNIINDLVFLLDSKDEQNCIAASLVAVNCNNQGVLERLKKHQNFIEVKSEKWDLII